MAPSHRVPELVDPRLDQILDFCAQEPIERVFLEDIARRRLGRFSATAEDGRLTALCHVGANVVPTGVGCGAFAGLAAAVGARMVIGEERAVGELWEEGGVILFKAEASAWTPRAVQLQQVWVDPVARNQGYAKRGLRDLCRFLLARVPAVCLFVRPENAPAIRVYDGIGMRRTISYRSLVF